MTALTTLTARLAHAREQERWWATQHGDLAAARHWIWRCRARRLERLIAEMGKVAA